MGQLTEAKGRLAEAQAKYDHLLASISEAQRIIAECRQQAQHLAGDVAGEIDNNVRLEQALDVASRLERERYVQQQRVELARQQVEKLEHQRRLAESEVTDCDLSLLDWQAKRRGERLRAVCDELDALTGDMNAIAAGRYVSSFRDAALTCRATLGAYTSLQQRYASAQALLVKLGE